MVRIVGSGSADDASVKLPSGPFDATASGSLEDALRSTVLDETGLDLGHVEQLDAAFRDPLTGVSITYLALSHAPADAEAATGCWQSWYRHFPWEDWRRGKPQVLVNVIEPRLVDWITAGEAKANLRRDCARMLFGHDGGAWDEEKVLERFDLLAEAGILAELRPSAPLGASARGVGSLCGEHRRALAMAMGRLRARIKNKPVVFDLMPPLFTLFELQRAVEAVLGPHLHKQNFRRLVEHMGLVEPTDEVKTHTGGRPAKLFRFRPSVLLERCQPGVRVRSARH
jgi:hypothetical protein